MPTQRLGPNYTTGESVTVSNASKALTTGTIPDLPFAFITVEGAQVRFWSWGATTAPTASVGHVLDVGDDLYLERPDELKNIRFIRTGGTDATLRCSYGN